jgi:predicted phosphodiesterase
MKVLITGDVHCDFPCLRKLIKNEKPEIVLQVGDFGVWPGNKKFEILLNTGYKVPVHFCDGNHEHHEYLKNLESLEIAKNVFYQPRGSILEINNKKILFVGGASSRDKSSRTPGHDWFPEEVISRELDLPNEEIDILICHTCPEMLLKEMLKLVGSTDNSPDPTRIFLDIVINKYFPEKIYFGHWHNFAEGTLFDNRIKWTVLNVIQSKFGYITIEI